MFVEEMHGDPSMMGIPRSIAQQTENSVEERIGEREITMDSRVVVPNV
jgi:hypothetical protein